jgi:hypothetical protein
MMTSKSSSSSNAAHARRFKGLAALAAMSVTLMASAQPSPKLDGNLDLTACDASGVFRTFASKPGETLSTDYGVTGAMGNVFIDVSPETNCSGSSPTLNCLTNKVTVQAPAPLDAGVPATEKVKLTSAAAFVAGDVGLEAKWSTTASNAPDGTNTCEQHYRFHVTSTGGGWGDPHLTTVDGVHYDFQSAGEFTALRKDDFEVQTRQTAVPTATVPITNEYTGITHCVALYTAVAVKFGKSRVTLQPGLASGEADPDAMQLRINGTLTTLGRTAIVLRSGGDSPGVAGASGTRGTFDGIIRKNADGTIEMTDAGGTQVVVTPAFWNSQHLWYLNVNVYQTSAILGTMGKIAAGSWLPALPDGSSLGPKPESVDQRYQDLYETFADGWRVTDTSSLFDYAQGQNSATFTLDEWPRNHPQSCELEGQPSVQGTTAAEAAAACVNVTDPRQKADCDFDVAITGNTGFGRSYEVMQGFRPAGTGWANVTPGDEVKPPPPVDVKPWWLQWWWLILLLFLLLLFLLMRMKSSP